MPFENILYKFGEVEKALQEEKRYAIGEEPQELTTAKLLSGDNLGDGLVYDLEVKSTLDKIAKYFANEFTEVTGDSEFALVCELFLKSLFQYKYVFVAYGDEFINLEAALMFKNSSLNFWDLKTHYKWRFYVLNEVPADKKSTKYKYTSLITNIPGIVLDHSQLIPVSWDEYHWLRFSNWYKLANDLKALETKLFNLIKLYSKKTNFQLLDNTHTDALHKSIDDLRAYIVSYATSTIPSCNFDFGEVGDLQTFLDFILSWFYYKAGMLGYTSNISDKAERQTTGEHYKDLKQVSNYQSATLSNLNNFAKEALIRYGKVLKFEVTSKPTEEGAAMMGNDNKPKDDDNKPKQNTNDE